MKKPKNIEVIKEINQTVSEYRGKAKISECFHHNKSECQGPIKRAHTVQRNGRLSLVEGEVNGNMKLYSFTEIKLNVEQTEVELKPIGKGEASTFFGFCDYHDNVLFSVIEDEEFDETDEQCFMFTYRGFAQTHHRKLEQLKAYTTPSKMNDITGNNGPNQVGGTSNGISDGHRIRSKFNEILDQQSYNKLDYLIIDLDGFYPLACSASFSPSFSPKNNIELNNSSDSRVQYEFVFINVIPDKSGTKAMLSCLSEDKKSVLYLDEFEELTFTRQQMILTSIMIGLVENTFISPYIYDKLSKNQKRILMDELFKTSNNVYVPRINHFVSKLNFFDRKFILNS